MHGVTHHGPYDGPLSNCQGRYSYVDSQTTALYNTSKETMDLGDQVSDGGSPFDRTRQQTKENACAATATQEPATASETMNIEQSRKDVPNIVGAVRGVVGQDGWGDDDAGWKPPRTVIGYPNGYNGGNAVDGFGFQFYVGTDYAATIFYGHCISGEPPKLGTPLNPSPSDVP